MLRIIATVLLFSFGRIAYGDELDDAITALNSGQYETAAELLVPLALDNNAFAQYNLAVMLEQGQGFEVSYEKAFHWYQRASSAGIPQAIFQIGNMYQYGRGVQKSLVNAVANYELAAEKGNGDALVALADLYFNGEFFSADKVKAFSLWVEAVNLTENPSAAYNAGRALFEGDGVDVELANGLKFFEIAVKHKHPGAMYYLANYHDRGLAGKKIDKTKAAFWYEKAATKGHRIAKHNLANMHMKGEGVRKDVHTAFNLYREAAYLGFPNSQLNLSLNYKLGLGTNIDVEKAVLWLFVARINGARNAKLDEIILSNFDGNKKKLLLKRAKDCALSGYQVKICG